MPGMGMPGMMGPQMPAMPPYGHSQPLPPFAAGAPNIGMPQMPMMGGGMGGNAIAQTAMMWNSQHFKPGQTHRCADFVSSILRQSGQVGPNFRHDVSVAQLQQQGMPVHPSQMQPGDVVTFGNTYRNGQYTHVGIYVGNGQFIHRPTSNKPVRIDRLDQGYYGSRLSGVRRFA